MTSAGLLRAAHGRRITMTGRMLRVAPPSGALLYPGLVWCGPALSPLFLGVSLVVPVLGLVAFHRVAPTFPRSRAVALLAVGAPALYSWLGGVLDFQTTLPLHALHVWHPFWLAAAAVTFFEREANRPNASASPARLAYAHGLSAAVIAAFAAAHVINHLFGLAGAERHIAVMSALRTIYRHPLVEPVLLACVGFQAASGLWLLSRKASRAGGWIDSVQSASGAYLACFFLSHLTAALRARLLRGVDTNWLWLTADSMLTDPWSARLAPYYFLAIVALGIHGGAGLRHVLRQRGEPPAVADRVFVVGAATAIVVSALVMAGLLTPLPPLPPSGL
jgi:succinate dehydrogenase/fumarate reductase cytochrome b subunit